MKLRTKLAIVLLVITVLLSVATTGGLELYKQQQMLETQESIDETGGITATRIGGAISQLEDDIGYVSSQSSLQRLHQTISDGAATEPQGWRVVVTRDASRLTTELQNLAISQASVGAVLLLVIGVGYWQYTTNLRQTEPLLEGFGEMQEDNYDYSLTLGAGEEWVQISDGFNDLSMGLKRREVRLRNRNHQ